MDSRGSSPLARGLRAIRESTGWLFGIIPARAGFTPLRSGRPTTRTDHPRSRGVYPDTRLTRRRGRGSSPLARGLPRLLQERDHLLRIIPARAGFTPGDHGLHRSLKDHPRSRGVYRSRRPGSRSRAGSSPLARGLRSAAAAVAFALGIIPARAGFTTIRRSARRWLRDHPRSRGVYRSIWVCAPTIAGSSPLARGLHLPAAQRGPGGRIIPARAGFTGKTGGNYARY